MQGSSYCSFYELNWNGRESTASVLNPSLHLEEEAMEIVTDKSVQDLVARVIGEIKRQRHLQGISMARLARLTGLHASTISLVERGKRSPSLFVVIKLTEALRINLGSILSECERAQLAGRHSQWGGTTGDRTDTAPGLAAGARNIGAGA